MKKIYFIILIACIHQLNAQVCFTSMNYPTVPNSNKTIACADFNSDGKLDLVVGDYANSSIHMLPGNGLGGFGAATIVNTDDDSVNFQYFITYDFNNDGKADLAGVEWGFPGSVKILFGDGLGNFPLIDSLGYSLVVSCPVGDMPYQVCNADFNGDGKTDFATANSSSGNVSVLLGDGTGNFSVHVDFQAGSSPNSICSGDFNGDSKVDLAVTNNANGGGPDSVYILLGNGIGGFAIATKYLAGSSPYSICSNDFNSDGFADIAVANINSNDVSVLWSQGANGGFDPAHNFAAGSQPWSVVSADFNSNGIPDLAIGDHNNSVSVLLDSSGMFGAPYTFTAYAGPWQIISADFNSDGKPDLATANQSSSDISVLLNVVAPNVSISSSNPDTICKGLSTTLTASGSSTYTWSSNADVNNPYDTVSTATVTPSSSIAYTVIGGESGCIDSATIFINVITPVVPLICMVTTDSASNYNIVYWDKTPYTNVDSFIVYRKDAISSSYLPIGAVSKNSLSEFTDTAFSIGGPNGGNPQYSSWMYKLAILDTCGNIGEKSPFHQSMFFQKSGSNFSWNAYTVEGGQANPVTGYSFLRDDNNTGNWNVLVNTTSLSATDPNYASFPNGNWRIDALGFDCTPGKTQSYLKSKSNTSKLVQTGIEHLTVNDEQVNVYPNPCNGNFIVETTLKGKQSVRLFDLNGRIVFSKNSSDKKNIDATILKEGIYNLEIITGDGILNKKLVIIK